MEKELTERQKKYIKKLQKLSKFRLLDTYIKIQKHYAEKHNTKMEAIDALLAKAPCPGCHTYDEADKLTDQAFEEFNKSKQHQKKYVYALKYKKKKLELLQNKINEQIEKKPGPQKFEYEEADVIMDLAFKTKTK